EPGRGGGAADAVRGREQARSRRLVAGRGGACAPGQDPLPARVRRSLPGLRQEPKRRAAHARGGAGGLPLGGPRAASRPSLGETVSRVAAERVVQRQDETGRGDLVVFTNRQNP